MTVRQGAAGVILLEDECPVEDAEPLLALLQSAAAPVIDWTACRHLHTAVLQLVLAARPSIRGPCGDLFVRRWIEREMP